MNLNITSTDYDAGVTGPFEDVKEELGLRDLFVLSIYPHIYAQ